MACMENNCGSSGRLCPRNYNIEREGVMELILLLVCIALLKWGDGGDFKVK